MKAQAGTLHASVGTHTAPDNQKPSKALQLRAKCLPFTRPTPQKPWMWQLELYFKKQQKKSN